MSKDPPKPIEPALLGLARLIAKSAFERLERGESLPPKAEEKTRRRQEERSKEVKTRRHGDKKE